MAEGATFFDPIYADRLEGGYVLIPRVREDAFLDRAARDAMVRAIEAMKDPRLGRLVCRDPLAIEAAPPSYRLDATPSEFARAAIDLLDLGAELAGAGIATFLFHAYAVRVDGQVQVRCPAPTAPADLHVRNIAPGSWAEEVAHWLRVRVPEKKRFFSRRKRPKLGHREVLRALEARIRPLAPDESARLDAVVERASAVPTRRSIALDFDAAIRLGEEVVAQVTEGFGNESTVWALAAAYHHRGCVRLRDGALDAAREDLDRAVALDPYPTYLTTRALLGERAGESVESLRALHDQAVERARLRPPHEFEKPAKLARVTARTLWARGAFRLQRGLAGGREDLARALELTPDDERIRRALERATLGT